MAREIRPICNFIFGSIRTSLLKDTVDVDLTIQTVKGIYTYRKDHTVESMLFTPWSKKVIPFPFLRQKIQAFQDNKRQEMAMPWNDGNTIQFSAPLKMLRNQRKRTTGKIRARWSGRNRFSPIKMRRPNTQETKMSDLDKVDKIDTGINAPVLTKAYNIFGLLCSFCKQGALHPSPKSWTGPAKTGMVSKLKQKERPIY